MDDRLRLRAAVLLGASGGPRTEETVRFEVRRSRRVVGERLLERSAAKELGESCANGRAVRLAEVPSRKPIKLLFLLLSPI